MSLRIAALVVVLFATGCSTTKVCCTGGDLVHAGEPLVAAYHHDIGGTTRPVYVFGASGPLVLLMHEMPGLTAETVRLAEFLADEGFVVHLPLLFGEPLRRAPVENMLCLAADGDWRVLTADRTSPVVDDLRALVDVIARKHGGDVKIGAIGMCLTGSYPLALLSDRRVVAPVLAQPALPLLAWCDAGRRALDLSPADLAHARSRVVDEGLGVFALRFEEDGYSPAPRFARLCELFGDAFDGQEISACEVAEAGLPPDAHATLTEHFSREPSHPIGKRLPKLLAFLHDALDP